MADKRTVYLVVEATWDYDDEVWHGDDVPVMAFSDKKKAKAHAEERTKAALAGVDLDSEEYAPAYVVVEHKLEG
jgi:hypothetical protein